MAPSKSNSKSAADERILSYHDATLHRSDLSILSTPSFLNDRIIYFYFTHLSLSLPDPSPTLLLPPSLSFLLSHLPDPHLVGPLRLPSRSLILLPVNDNPDVTLAEGGLHWSLLVYHRPTNQFVHHDSSRRGNSPAARRLFRAVRGLVGGDGEAAGFVEGFTPQQRNGVDCGLYVMAIAKVICEWNGEEEEMWFGKLREEVDEERVGRLREEVLGLVRGLMQAGRDK